MECIDFEVRLQTCLDERLRAEDDVALVEHMQICPPCRGLAQTLGVALHAVAEMPTPPASTDLARRVLGELARPEVVRMRPVRQWVAVCAAAALMAAVSVSLGYWMGRHEGDLTERDSMMAENAPTDRDGPEAIAQAFWNAPFGADNQPAAAGDKVRWGQDVQTGLEPLTRSTAAALDALWQAIPEAEDSRS